ncbi:MAG: response regulator transcription factor [Bacteroidetes bacterium]|nr:response regulator transcription factor [Bacteroidota bacterium]
MQSKIVVVSRFQSDLGDLKKFLLKEGFEVIPIIEINSTNIELINNLAPQIVFLEMDMGNFDGIEICHQLKIEKKINGFVVISSTLPEEYIQIEAYKAGADDYIVKPISNRLLLRKLKALIKRTPKAQMSAKNNRISFKDIVIDRESYSILRGVEKIELPKKEFELLYLLFNNPQKTFTRSEIYKSVWDNVDNYNPRIIDVHIRKIREKIGNALISTVKGVGYQLAV